MRRADKKNKPQWFLDNVSPKGSVPVLRHGDKMIPDSKSIVQYIKATWKKPELAPMSRAVKKLEKCGITDIMYAARRARLSANNAASPCTDQRSTRQTPLWTVLCCAWERRGALSWMV